MRPETKQLLKNISIGLGVFFLVGFILYGVWHGTRVSALTIDEVIVAGGETISHQAVAADVSILLEGEYARFIPRSFAWTYPENEIMSKLLEVDRVKNPVIERDGKRLFVTLAEYEPIALWCDSAISERCVFLDSVGYSFASAPDLTGGAFTRFVQIGQPASTSELFTTADDFVLLRELESLLEEYGWPAATVEFDQARDVFVYLGGGGELKITLLQAPDATIANLQTVLSTEQYSHIKPGNFEYIDLRFGNKVFVNEFGAPEEESDIETETATSSDAAAE
ncbi:MAG: cell division septal protein FtsQ [Candidatus Paceibacteria bacterium]|jgi:cell division septal protein FtsQ